jgi:hypothetical protein
MIPRDELWTYAHGITAALRVIGPVPREQALGMLRALQLSADDAEAALAYAIEGGIIAAGPKGEVRAT